MSTRTVDEQGGKEPPSVERAQGMLISATSPAKQGLLYFTDMERPARHRWGVTCLGACCQPGAVPAARPASSSPTPKRPQTDRPEERAQQSRCLFSLLVQEKRNLVSILCVKSKICRKSTILNHSGPCILPKRVWKFKLHDLCSRKRFLVVFNNRGQVGTVLRSTRAEGLGSAPRGPSG